MPPAMTGPGPFNDPPLPGTPFTVSKSRAVLNSHSTCPSVVEWARSMPVVVPANNAPGMTLIAAECASIQLRCAGWHSFFGRHVHGLLRP